MGTPAQVLRVGSALPDPPFERYAASGPEGFDIDLTRALAGRLGRTWELHPYPGTDFEGIFDALDAGEFDCVASGTTITPARRERAEFCAPYYVSGQALAVDVRQHPGVRSIDDLEGLVIGVQQGNTSQPIADRLVAEGRAGRVRVYAYDEIPQAITDLSTGGCDAFMKLEPVLRTLAEPTASVRVVQAGISREEIAMSVARGNDELRDRLDDALRRLGASGTLAALVRRWLEPSAEGSG
jgi:ABC-type amino acid transport substrate-binding protein